MNILAMKAFQRVGTYWIVLPYQAQARKIIWDGMTGDGKRFIDFIPREAVQRKNEQNMRLHLVNGSIIQLMGSDNPDAMVGTNAVGVVFSEFALSDPHAYQLINPILRENGGWALFQSTPRGENHFYKLFLEAQANKEWFTSHLSAKDTKAISPDDLRKARSEASSEAIFQQEYMSSFKVPLEGSYYGPIISKLHKDKRMLDRLPPDPLLPVHTAWDLGMDDATSIWFFQHHRNEVRLLRYYENSGEGLPFYARELQRYASQRGVAYGKHYAPHDVKVRELGTGRSRLETAKSLGLKFTPVRKLPLMDGIEATRNLLPKCYFDRHETKLGVEHLKGYRKEYDSQKDVYKKTPVHDKHSHGADSLRTLAVGIKESRETDPRQQKNRHTYQEQPLDW